MVTTIELISNVNLPLQYNNWPFNAIIDACIVFRIDNFQNNVCRISEVIHAKLFCNCRFCCFSTNTYSRSKIYWFVANAFEMSWISNGLNWILTALNNRIFFLYLFSFRSFISFTFSHSPVTIGNRHSKQILAPNMWMLYFI